MRPPIGGTGRAIEVVAGTPESVWEAQAENWVRWARTPGHDAYWLYSPLFFDAIVPPPGRMTVEVGCGEGRVARDLAGRGHTVGGGCPRSCCSER